MASHGRRSVGQMVKKRFKPTSPEQYELECARERIEIEHSIVRIINDFERRQVAIQNYIAAGATVRLSEYLTVGVSELIDLKKRIERIGGTESNHLLGLLEPIFAFLEKSRREVIGQLSKVRLIS